MAWRVAESLEVLRKQLNDAFPKRSKASDGGIGDAKHASRSSDHNPWIKDKKGVGVVSARDFTHDPKTGIDCNWLAETLVENKDPRIKYIIWNKRICSSLTAPWTWRPYKGTNAHTKHLHISVSDAPAKYDSKKLWVLDFADDEGDDVAKVTLASTISADSPKPPTIKADTSAQPEEQAGIDAAGSPPIQSGTTQIAENIVNTAPPSTPAPEDKTLEAPPKDGATATSTKMVIAGITVPPVAAGLLKGVSDAVTNGYVSAAEIGSFLMNLLRENLKWVLGLVGLMIVLLIVKKILKQIAFFLEMLTKAIPGWNNITVVPAPVEKKPWWKIW